jgi:protein-L-isoaspartate(D-aspartate) O-methyltransferase
MKSGPDFASLRAEMVERQLRRREIDDERVLAAMGSVPRELFVPLRLRRRAYADSALPIGEGQTISQPWIVAAICQALRLGGEERVLEVGTGSGYSAAVLGLLAREVIGIELQPVLAGRAKLAIAELGAANVEVIVGDGSRGLPERAPFDAIAVHAAAPAPPRALLDQLAEGGRLVAPIATDAADMLTVFRRQGEGFPSEEIGPCRFVPLLGEEGFPRD